MYGLTNFLSVLWYSVLECFGLGRDVARAVSLFDGELEAGIDAEGIRRGDSEEEPEFGVMNLDTDIRYSHPHGWGFDTRN